MKKRVSLKEGKGILEGEFGFMSGRERGRPR